MTPIEAGETILQAINYILKTYPENLDKIKELEAQQADLLHFLEFDPLTRPIGYKFAKEIKEVRLSRRKFKDENEILKPLYEYLTNGNSQSFIVGLTSNLGKARKRGDQLHLREYGPRSQAFQQVNEVMPCN
ncbi:MAG TPA: hypothetical protein DDZ66_02330 [Firmicutes bacterium]|nr:hypothetical protein [Bacillota bacterium]